MGNEAAARLKINKLFEAAGWRFFADAGGPPDIQLESGVTLKTTDLDTLEQDTGLQADSDGVASRGRPGG